MARLVSRKRPAEDVLGRQRGRCALDLEEEQPAEVAPTSSSCPALEMSLMVRWHSVTGKTRTNSLSLTHLTSLSKLVGLSSDLFNTAYPESNRPPHLASDDYFTFTPEEECLSLPGDVARTTLRLVANYNGWEFVVLERELHSAPVSGTSREVDHSMLVAVVEFESTAMVIGNFGLRLHLVAYPVVSVKKTFLRDIEERLRTDPNFKGILS